MHKDRLELDSNGARHYVSTGKSKQSPRRFHIFFVPRGFLGAVFEWVPAQNADIHHMLLLFKKKKKALVFGTI